MATSSAEVDFSTVLQMVETTPSGPYSADVLARELKGTGFPRLLITSDEEHSIVAPKREAARKVTADHGVGVVFEESPVGNCTTTTTSSSTSTTEPYPEPEEDAVDEQPDPEPLAQRARMESEEQARMEAEDLDYYGHDAEDRSFLYRIGFTLSRRAVITKKRRLESSGSGSGPPSGSSSSTTTTTTSCGLHTHQPVHRKRESQRVDRL
jgi:hypothetical protein